MLESLRNKKLLIVVAHPDDELLGLGSSMNRLIKEYEVETHVVILGEGITSRSDERDVSKWETELSLHRENIKQAQNAVGYHSVSIYDFPDNRFDTVALLDIIKVVEKEKEQFKPDAIFTHHSGDLNVDHQKTFEAVMTACRPMDHEIVKTIITFETPSGTEWQSPTHPRPFLPNFFITLSEENVLAKINGMECYQFEKRVYPHPRSPEALRIQAKRWGIAIGSEYAEAFMIIRQIC